MSVSKGCLPKTSLEKVACWPFCRLAKRLDVSMPLLLPVAGWPVSKVKHLHVMRAEVGCSLAHHWLQGKPGHNLDSYLLCPVGIVGQLGA